ncbi:MAG: PHP domain-containing protein [Blastocatellia bacterium]
MKANLRNVRFLERGEKLSNAAMTGVSLHCHTLHSKELLDFVPYYAERIPVVSYFWRREMRRHMERDGRLPDFTKGYWAPPLTGHDVFGMEAKSMRRLGLDAIVSITDHDSINANLELLHDIDGKKAPVSMEWTVPFEEAFFHIGVHNLPVDRAEAITSELLAYTHAKGKPDNARLHQIFEMLNEIPETLVVLNHPIWDIEMIGQQTHERLLARFVAEHAKWMHALEINGFRSWDENQLVVDMAEAIGLPLVSGGDRHCCQSNTMINITDAGSFDEFAAEIRDDGYSRIAIMPEYNDPLPSRQLRSMAQILGNYSHFPEGRRIWSDRIYLDYQDGEGLKSLTERWNGRIPKWTYFAFAALSALGHPIMQPMIALTVGDTDIGRDERKTPDTGFAIGNSPLSAER